jgi:hypothetical protein
MSDYLVDYEGTIDGDLLETDMVFESDAEDIDVVESEALAYLKEQNPDITDLKIVAIQELDGEPVEGVAL